MLRKIVLCCLLVLCLSAQDDLPLYDLPNAFAPVNHSGSMAISAGGRLIVSNPIANHISIISPNLGEMDAELNIGAMPNGVTVTPDSQRALAVSQADGTLSVIDLNTNDIITEYTIGNSPYHVVADDQRAYVSLFDDSLVQVIDIETGELIAEIATPEYPAGMALWGSFLYVTHFWSGEFSLIYLPAQKVVQTIQPDPNASLSRGVEINPVNGVAYLPQTLVNERLESLTPVIHTIDLKTFLVQSQFDLSSSEILISLPFAAAQPSNRTRLYIANAGSDTVTVLNLDNQTIATTVDVGANPRAILFNRNFARFYTQDAVDSTVTFINTAFFGLDDTFPAVTDAVSPALQIGATLFHSATDTRMSDGRGFACVTCHYNGSSDGKQWGDAETPRLVDTVTNAEQLNQHIAMMQGGTGLEPTALDMLSLLTYLELWQK